MRPARPGAPLPALLLLALALSPHGIHGRPRGRRGARVADRESKPLLFLPAAAARPAPSAVRSAEIFPRDLNLKDKDKFIKHFTGPVAFPAECSKHFHRLYYNTRDCSTPAYYKRCARLLTRLSVSPLCSQT
ncbi:PREDICTED: protein FAM150A [Propithecus coquereli]|uniref:ALK and LTK ligand 1 n=1 Tax=Propithecus coquereli TaxID=379532 RepID=A0A2K6G7Q8_PROCO|nr:PREDICTED: protein FAM150A [Propithecus coquereli]